MKRLLTILFILYFRMAQAELTLQVDDTSVSLGQNINISLFTDSSSSTPPDVRPLQQDFKILATEQSTNYTLFNNQAKTSTQWTFVLSPKRAGKLTIPPIKVGKEQTKAITIEVTADATGSDNLGNQVADKQDDVILAAEVSNQNPMLNEQVMYTVRLYNSRRLIDSNFQGPTVDNGLFIPIDKGLHYQTTLNGRIYGVDEQLYALFPQKSGKMVIHPPTFSAMAFDNLSQQINAKGPDLELNVKTPPDTFKGKNWLPAKEVVLSESYDIDTDTIEEGNTLVRTVNITATGLPAQLLPALVFKSSDAFSVYNNDKPLEKNTVPKGDLLGQTTVKVTYLFNKPGQVEIPTLELPWFNTVTGKQEMASLPAMVMNVTPKPGATASEEITKPEVVPEKKQEIAASQITPSSNSFAWWLVSGLALAWLITVLMWWLQRKRGSNKDNSKKNKKNTSLKSACLSNQPVLARAALLQWAKEKWPDKSMLNLDDISQMLTDEMFKQELDRLSKAIYRSEDEGWDGRILWGCIENFKKGNKQRPKKKSNLPPLNP